jgi:hypothetical protein
VELIRGLRKQLSRPQRNFDYGNDLEKEIHTT